MIIFQATVLPHIFSNTYSENNVKNILNSAKYGNKMDIPLD
jgi:hypothetical protein